MVKVVTQASPQYPSSYGAESASSSSSGSSSKIHRTASTAAHRSTVEVGTVPESEVRSIYPALREALNHCLLAGNNRFSALSAMLAKLPERDKSDIPIKSQISGALEKCQTATETLDQELWLLDQITFSLGNGLMDSDVEVARAKVAQACKGVVRAFSGLEAPIQNYREKHDSTQAAISLAMIGAVVSALVVAAVVVLCPLSIIPLLGVAGGAALLGMGFSGIGAALLTRPQTRMDDLQNKLMEDLGAVVNGAGSLLKQSAMAMAELRGMVGQSIAVAIADQRKKSPEKINKQFRHDFFRDLKIDAEPYVVNGRSLLDGMRDEVRIALSPDFESAAADLQRAEARAAVLQGVDQAISAVCKTNGALDEQRRDSLRVLLSQTSMNACLEAITFAVEKYFSLPPLSISVVPERRKVTTHIDVDESGVANGGEVTFALVTKFVGAPTDDPEKGTEAGARICFNFKLEQGRVGVHVKDVDIADVLVAINQQAAISDPFKPEFVLRDRIDGFRRVKGKAAVAEGSGDSKSTQKSTHGSSRSDGALETD
jgi:hypothetical protein